MDYRGEMDSNIVAGLDIGTSKVAVVIAEQNTQKEMVVLGVGHVPYHGLRKGMIMNLDETADSILSAVESAELMAGVEIPPLYTAITGTHVDGINQRGVVAVSNRNKEITQKELDRVIEAAQSVSLPTDREILHVLPWEFIVDGQDGIKEPTGMSGVRLEVDAHIVMAGTSALNNMRRSIERAGLGIEDFILSSRASAEAVLSEDEKEVGVLVLDIGAGTMDAILFVHGNIYYNAVFPIAGKHISRDISVGLKIAEPLAEKIKLEYGYCSDAGAENRNDFEIPSFAGRTKRVISHHALRTIIEARVSEIFDLVYQDLNQRSLSQLAQGGVVITGGMALLEGIEELAERIFRVPTRCSMPDRIAGLVDKVSSPVYSTAVGLALYGLKDAQEFSFLDAKTNLFTRMKNSISGFARDFFTSL